MTTRGHGYAAALAAVVVVSVLVTGCAGEPAAPPQIPPTVTAAANVHHQDARITLPVTVGIAFHHPTLANSAEYQVLFTVQQAMRAMVQAEYTSNGQDSELAQYWFGIGLTAVDTQVKQWISRQQQPVGVIVLENTNYTAQSAKNPAKVTLCADWSHVFRGDTRTHVVGPAVQPKGVKATYEQMDLARAADGRWRVNTLLLTPNSRLCP